MRPIDATVLATVVAAATTPQHPHTDADAYNDGQWGALPATHFYTIKDEAPVLLVKTWNRADEASPNSHIFIQHDAAVQGIFDHTDDSSSSSSSPPPEAAIAAAETRRRRSVPGSFLRSSPLILKADDLSTVYVNRSFPGVANVNVQEYEGKPLLTFFGGTIDGEEGEVGNGWIFAYDENYQEVGRLSAEKLAVGADAHEFIMTGPKTGIVTAYQPIPRDLTALSPIPSAVNATLLDSIFQEIDLDTFDVLFEWRASDHIDLDMSFAALDEETLQAPDASWDYFHLTSVQKSPSTGHYLISGAHTHSLYEIDGTTGAIRWTLGGKANDFTELEPPRGRNFTGPVLSMAWQHHARWHPASNERAITVFDNHEASINGWGCSEDCSRGLHFAIDAGAKTVQLLNEYQHPLGLWSTSEGSVQVLPNGNVFIGWGRNPAVTEHAPDGTVVFDMQFSPYRSPKTAWTSLDSYRAFKAEWNATPTAWGPALVADKGRMGDLTAYMSWNGATGVRGWALLASNKAHDLDGAAKVVATSDRNGFETKVWLPVFGQRYLRAVALGEHGAILGASGVYDTMRRKTDEVDYPVTEVDSGKTPAQAAQQGLEPGQNAGGASWSGSAEEGGPGGEVRIGSGTSSVGDAGKVSKTGQDKGGLRRLREHGVMSSHWSGGGIFLRIVGVVLGVWAFSRLF